LRLLAALVTVGLAAGTARAAERVDLELVLLADASGSIDEGEIRFQRHCYAAAITHPEVLAAISQGFSQRIAVTFVEWGSAGSQEVVVPWMIVDGTGTAQAFAQALLEPPRRAYGMNAIGSAIAFAHDLIERNGIEPSGG
jgi:hypothetical protein